MTLDWDNLTICLASFHDSQLKGGKGVLDIDPLTHKITSLSCNICWSILNIPYTFKSISFSLGLAGGKPISMKPYPLKLYKEQQKLHSCYL